MSPSNPFLLAALTLPWSIASTAVYAQEKKARPQVEVVFCLDTTGSMGGLISAAKQKIWAICNQIASGNPTPRVKVGMVAYRDRSDDFVTKVFDLTEDLDSIYSDLMGFQARGGGDFPESVNQALDEAVEKISWSKDPKTLKIIFLVGDASPHMNYNEKKYPEICQVAVKRGIIINTVQCGNNGDTRGHWQKICHLAEGSYVQIDAKGGPIVAVATPFDKKLAEINSELTATTLVFGNQKMQAAAESKKALNGALAAPAAAERASFYARSGGGASYDLLRNVQAGKVKLEDLKKDELPPELKNLNLEQQKAYLKKLETRRNELSVEALKLNKQRNDFIAKKLAADEKNRSRDSFDNQVLGILQRQAVRNGIEYATPAAKKD